MFRKSKHNRGRKALAGTKVSLTYYRSASSGVKDGNSPFTKSSKQPRKLRKAAFKVLDLLVIIFLLGLFLYSLILKDEGIVSANHYPYREQKDYQQAFKNQLEQLSNRNKLTINEAAIVSHLKDQFPEIAGAKLELPIVSQTPKIHLDISPPALVVSNNTESFIVSRQGVVVGKASDFRGLKNLPKVDDQTGFNMEKGASALASSEIEFIEEVYRDLIKSGVKISSLSLPTVPMEMNLRTENEGYFVKFYLGGDADLQTGQLLAAREKFFKDSIRPDEYLDVRVQGKIFYK